MSKQVLLVGILVSFLFLSGCAGSGMMKRTEEGFMPTHVAVGEVFAYNTAGTMKNTALVSLFTRNLEEAFNNQDVRYIPMKELDTSPVSPEATIMVEAEISFQQGTRMGTDVRVTYTLRRRSDNLVWIDGSAKASDLPNSEQALQDLTTGIQFAAKACAGEIKSAMQGSDSPE